MVPAPCTQSIVESSHIEMVIFEIIEIFIISHISDTEGGESNRKGLREFAGSIKHFVSRNSVHILGRKIGGLFIHCFLDIGDLEGVGE